MTEVAHIASIACVVPPLQLDQKLAVDLIKTHFRESLSHRGLAWLRATFSHPGIRTRHFAVDDPARIMDESPDQRIARFTEQSILLATEAACLALERAGAEPGEVNCLVVNTCTGYICPGISTYLIERLGLSRDVKAFDLVGSGCGGAIPNLQVSEALLRAHGGCVVSISVEICSAAFQMDNDLSLILSNALFADGAAAVVLRNTPRGLKLMATAGRYVPEQREAIRFIHKNGQLHNQLSTELPGMVQQAAAGTVSDLLAPQGLGIDDITHWALHTGGDRIISAVGDGIGLSGEQLAATRNVLAKYGNMSSPTVWFVLEELLKKGVSPGDKCVMLAYGAGLSAHACLLEVGPFNPPPFMGGPNGPKGLGEGDSSDLKPMP